MNELQYFQPLQLGNLLAQETISYYKLIGDGASLEECTQCNNRIRQIEMELDSKRPREGNILKRPSKSVPFEYLF